MDAISSDFGRKPVLSALITRLVGLDNVEFSEKELVDHCDSRYFYHNVVYICSKASRIDSE